MKKKRDNMFINLKDLLLESRLAPITKWNKNWEVWLSNNPRATPEEIFKHIGVMIHDFGLDGFMKIVP